VSIGSIRSERWDRSNEEDVGRPINEEEEDPWVGSIRIGICLREKKNSRGEMRRESPCKRQEEE